MQLSLLTVVSMILVLVSTSAESTSLRGDSMKRGLLTKKCSDERSGEEYGGDCSATPTYCGRGFDPEFRNVVGCYYGPPRFGEEDIPPNSDDAHLCFDKRCSGEVEEDFPDWCRSDYMGRFGVYRGICRSTDACLNLDFYCADGEYCELWCNEDSSCNGVTMHCADNQFCEIRYCGDRTERCVGASVVCGEGTVARDLRCEPAATSPTEPIILTPTITYTCVGVTCRNGSDGSTCGSDGGCCPFGNTPSDSQCACGISWSDANMNKIGCKLTQQQPESEPETAVLTQQQPEPEPEIALLTQQQPEPEPETASPTSNPTSEPQPETTSPTFNLATLSIGSRCCSQNFRTCASYGGDSKESCELVESMIWLENGDTQLQQQQCIEQWSPCTNDINACCPGLTCIGNSKWYKQCKFIKS